MLLDHLDGILNYCRTKVPLGVVEAVNGNILEVSAGIALSLRCLRALPSNPAKYFLLSC